VRVFLHALNSNPIVRVTCFKRLQLLLKFFEKIFESLLRTNCCGSHFSIAVPGFFCPCKKICRLIGISSQNDQAVAKFILLVKLNHLVNSILSCSWVLRLVSSTPSFISFTATIVFSGPREVVLHDAFELSHVVFHKL
jgi:hypothetical protein